MAGLLTPSPSDRMQHRLLLLFSLVKEHNRTDVTLLVHFHAGWRDGFEVLKVPIKRTMRCDAALLGCAIHTSLCVRTRLARSRLRI